MSESAAKKLETTGYFLHVEMIVKDETGFEGAMRAFMDLALDPKRPFLRLNPEADAELVLALKSEPFRLESSDWSGGFAEGDRTKQRGGRDGRGDDRSGDEVTRYVHLWSVPGPDDLDLARIMLASADDSPYMDINATIKVERQDFVRRVNRTRQPCEVRKEKLFYRLIRRVPATDLGSYIFYSGTWIPALERAGYGHWNQFQNVTGILNTVVEFWTSAENGLSSDLLIQRTDPLLDENQNPVPKDAERLADYEMVEVYSLPNYFKELI